MVDAGLSRLGGLAVFGLASILAGCGLTPASGPTRDAFVKSVYSPVEEGRPPFAFVEINGLSLAILARRAPPTMRGLFGDYRPPASPVIGAGDTVKITVWEAAGGGLFSAADAGSMNSGARAANIPDQVVRRDGSVNVPYAGSIRIAGMTSRQAEAAIIERLRGKAIEPQALVTVANNLSNTVTVTGEVANGARVPISQRGERIMDVIAAAGGYNSPVHETYVSLTRGDRTARAPIHALLSNPSEDVYMRPGDILTVERTPPSFTVAGATGSNSVLTFDARGLTLEEAIGKAGGLEDSRADPDGVFVLRYEPVSLVREFPNIEPNLLKKSEAPVAYHLNMRDPSALLAARKFQMRDKDILYVSNAPIAEIAKVMQLVSMASHPVQQGLLAGRYLQPTGDNGAAQAAANARLVRAIAKTQAAGGGQGAGGGAAGQ